MEFATASGTEILNVLSISNIRLIASSESNPSSAKVLVTDTCSRGIRLVEAIKSSTFSVMSSGISWLSLAFGWIDERKEYTLQRFGWVNPPAEPFLAFVLRDPSRNPERSRRSPRLRINKNWSAPGRRFSNFCARPRVREAAVDYLIPGVMALYRQLPSATSAYCGLASLSHVVNVFPPAARC
jgi:hypothetical protein